MIKKKQNNITDEERLSYEKGFEDGYAVAVRLYKIVGINYVTKGDLEERLPVRHYKIINKRLSKQGFVK